MELIYEKLAKFKERLLDLTTRNRLLHSNFQARTTNLFRVIDELPDQLYHTLISGKRMYFEPLPPLEDDPKDENTKKFLEQVEVRMSTDEDFLRALENIENEEVEDTNQAFEIALRRLKDSLRKELEMPSRKVVARDLREHARKKGLNPSFELPRKSGQDELPGKWTNLKIQTLLLPDTLKRYERTIERQHKSSLKESGVNPLYFAFGFLEWRENSTSQRVLYAPLLLLQVEYADQTRGGRKKVISSGDSLYVNQALNEKLRRIDVNKLPELPDLDEENGQYSLEKYFEKVEEQLARQNHWKVRRWVSFGIYRAQSMPIYQDLAKIERTGPSELLKNILSGGTQSSEAGTVETYDIDDIEKNSSIPVLPPLVAPADACQHSAVIDVLKGKNLVIKGPPGTGKSQTITNIISSLMFGGKKVLFVAQKQAALDVVKNNLAHCGLEDYILEVFSIKASKSRVFASIKKRVDKEKPINPINFDGQQEKYKETKAELNRYRRLMAELFGETKKTIHELFWDIPELNFSLPAVLQSFAIVDASLISQSKLDESMKDLGYLSNRHEELFKRKTLEKSPMRAIQALLKGKFEIQDAQKKIAETAQQLNEIQGRKQKVLASNSTLGTLSDEAYRAGGPVDLLSKEFANCTSDGLPDLVLSTSASDQIEEWHDKTVALNTYRSQYNAFLEISDNEPSSWATNGVSDHLSEEFVLWYKDAREHLELVASVNTTKEEIGSVFNIEENLHVLKEIRDASKALRTSNLFSFFSKNWQQARGVYNDLARDSSIKRSNIQKGQELGRLLGYLEKTESNSEKLNNVPGELRERLARLQDSITTHLSRESLAIERIASDVVNQCPSLNGFKETLAVYPMERCRTLIELARQLPEDFKNAWLTNSKSLDSYQNLLSESGGLVANVKSLLSKLDVDYKLAFGKDEFNTNIEDYLRYYNALAKSEISLYDYMSWLQAEKVVSGSDLAGFYRTFVESELPVEEISDVYKYKVRDAQQRAIYAEHGNSLSRYSGNYIGKLRRDLETYDKEVRAGAKEQISSTIYTEAEINGVPQGVSRGRVREKTEKGLIDHIIQKPNARISLRHFFENAGEAISALKPCTLMSPLSVSQILPLKELYDIVVIDEASQMKPEFSIASLARAKQVVIVGDLNQLPPTNFFEGKTDEEDDDFSDESILEMALTVLYPPRELLWHYRSRHEDLIRFSNAEFYQNLLIPVTANSEEENRGITNCYIDNGVYLSRAGGAKGGVNEIEAKRMVEAIITFMKNRENESLGVVTMNKSQTDLLQSLFDQRLQKESAAHNYVNKWESKNDGLHDFFIKNLESVQGDERDVMMVGCVYGPDRTGRVFQRFSIQGRYGWRRLNVLVSRAKNELILFTSMRPTDIKVDVESDRSRQAFQKYLAFAETKTLLEGKANVHDVESPFQQWAIDQVNAMPGFTADWEIGVVGYRIDIGVRHESLPGWIMAVETDGATYHSSRSARDRDFLRQNILEGHGWEFHRIWSTDWINDPIGVKVKLQEALKNRVDYLAKEQTRRRDLSELEIQNSLPDNDGEITSSVPQQTEFITDPYIIAEISDVIEPDPGMFHKEAYRNQLSVAITHVVDVEGPVEFGVLVKRVRQGHGWRKAGKPIRRTIKQAVPKSLIQTTFSDKVYYWSVESTPNQWKKARYPQDVDDGDNRKTEELSPEEIYAIGMCCKKERPNIARSDLAREISRFLGWKKCSNQAQEYIFEALDSVANVDAQL